MLGAQLLPKILIYRVSGIKKKKKKELCSHTPNFNSRSATFWLTHPEHVTSLLPMTTGVGRLTSQYLGEEQIK